MFFPEHLISKTGPLARVWLAANLEKKLSKNQVLQDKIIEDIGVILKPEVAGGPMALRLSGQLLLGVVRIYSRKARYLLDDCSEALMKIKMAFKPGNIDLPPNQSHIANPAGLILPDVLTDIDLLAPMPDPSFLLSQPLLDFNGGLDDAIAPDWDNSQFLSASIEQPRKPEPMILDAPDDLLIDIGEDLDDVYDEGPSVEAGRNAPLERRLSEEFASSPKILVDDGSELEIDIGEDPSDFPLGDMNVGFGDTDINMGGMTELEAPMEPTPTREIILERHNRESPLSSIRSSVERDLEHTFQEDQNTTTFEPQPEPEEEMEETAHQANRAKRRKVLEADVETTQISNNQIRDQQTNRDKILKPATFLPRDPLLLALMNMQKSGGFVSSILGDGRSQGWAPELRGILSLEVVSRPGQKRKRDSGVADLEIEGEDSAAGAEKTPQLEFEEAEPELDDVAVNMGGDTSLGQDDVQIQLPEDDVGAQPEEDPFGDEAFSPAPDNFDDTTAPLLYPADSGPISLGTKHAVHILRERFGHDEETSESEHKKSSVLFHEMLPEATTTRADATKMFFEVLVLATKDAIKVEQKVDQLGGPLRIRGKRGLYGSWAETSAGGELASQSVPASPTAAGEVDVEA
ncbi:hypothetical protein K505DRAFT_413677 [Melanomma pulvis-pyrius CBS 109.77]|uniref:Double-strand-break repair protein rad21 n=1 Tax=Melanomma pulvis-pyrius CBS 109.77 TaxID=1314802 RepID=A0A6A6XV72_9PLEO|nr:hypothetical protein K505DRAFT_413677 [Melanomma pulvis-pyrius CBS 109.77]